LRRARFVSKEITPCDFQRIRRMNERCPKTVRLFACPAGKPLRQGAASP
jgi:hypothetical protein